MRKVRAIIGIATAIVGGLFVANGLVVIGDASDVGGLSGLITLAGFTQIGWGLLLLCIALVVQVLDEFCATQ